MFGRTTTYRATWRKARTVGYKRSPAGFRHAMRDLIDATPLMRDMINMNRGKTIALSRPRRG